MRASEFITEEQLDEGWRDQLANLAISSALAGAAVGGAEVKQALTTPKQAPQAATAVTAPAPKQDVKPVLKPVAKSTVAKVAQPKKINVKPITGNPLENTLLKAAIASGIKGAELAAFMAQCAHESHDFKSLVEYGGSLDFRKYDPKYNRAKAKQLGNKFAGDGARYKGRGFIQITGRYNYQKAGKAIGIDLVKNPKLASDPKIAAKVAVWYWKHRVQPNVDNFHDVIEVTKPINPRLNGIEDRKENFKAYLRSAVPSAEVPA